MFERPRSGERAVLVHLDFHTDQQDALEEFRELALSAGADPVATVTGSRSRPDAKYFIGSGKAEELHERVVAEKAELVLVNHALSPAQERNLERLLQCRVLDRTGLILDIFAQRAKSHEGRLQVELAQLRHMSTRLVRGWTHLERQKGGIGLRGPGETQLETDRRLLRLRIKQLNKHLEKVSQRREQNRRPRRKAEIATVSLVGYTNAGKSTLFNQLTRSDVYAADQLFATLDSTLRRLALDDQVTAVLADTVGFVSNLPHELVAAFRSTLEETLEAQVLLHVIDASSPERDFNIAQVNTVLKEIGAEEIPQIEIFNKIDLMEGAEPRVERDDTGQVRRVWLSARTGNGVEQLRAVLAEYLKPAQTIYRLRLSPDASRLRARLFALGVVQEEQFDDQGNALLSIALKAGEWEQLQRHYGLTREMIC